MSGMFAQCVNMQVNVMGQICDVFDTSGINASKSIISSSTSVCLVSKLVWMHSVYI